MSTRIVFTPAGPLVVRAWRLKRALCLVRGHRAPIEWYNGAGWARVCPCCGSAL
jgi:hypothetical protein